MYPYYLKAYIDPILNNENLNKTEKKMALRQVNHCILTNDMIEEILKVEEATNNLKD